MNGVAAGEYDLVIIGGGILGACMLLEASRRGLRAVLLEKGEFGAATSANSLRILHGGLRYLQTADFPRMQTSIRERRWFCRHFPELVRPLACIMRLGESGLRTPAVMRAALAVNELMSAQRNAGVRPAARLPRGRVLSRAETLERVPALPADNLRGAALWYDALMLDSERLLMEIIAWGERLGGVALSGMRVIAADADAGGIRAVHAQDSNGTQHTFRSRVVMNCAGPWTEDVAAVLGSPAPGIFRRALAFNLLLDREPVADAALALSSRPGDRMLFLVPWHGRILAGTYHAPWSSSVTAPHAEPLQVAGMLDDINRALPALDCSAADVRAVLAGFMPAARADGTPASHPTLFDHGRHGGVPGLHSVITVKYTTARDVAERALARILGRRPLLPGSDRDESRAGTHGAPPVVGPDPVARPRG